MPSSVVKSIAKDTGKSEAEVEKLWDKAKKVVAKNYPEYGEDDDNFWKLVTGVTKKMSGMKEESRKFPSFKTFLTEAAKKIPFDGNIDLGWWEDADPITLYHGTHIENIDSFIKNGLNRKDPNTGMISLALEPYTARGYANMYGGEFNYGRSGKRKDVPMSERVVFVFEIPMNWIKSNMDHKHAVLMGQQKKHMTDRSEYEKWTRTDMEYYQLCEIRVKKEVPAKFIKAYMISK